MKCPVDGTELLMAERQGVEIDYCPKCRGIWLDRGELDKIVEKTMPAVELEDPDPFLGRPEPALQPEPQPAPEYRFRDSHPRDMRQEDRRDPRREERYDPRYETRRDGYRDDRRRDYDDDDRDYKKRDKYGRKKKRKSLFAEIIDIFD